MCCWLKEERRCWPWAARSYLLLPGAHLGGRLGPPPRCRAAWGTGRPAAGQPVLQGPARKFSPLKIVENPLPPRSGVTRCQLPGSGETRVYTCKFRKQKYIFCKKQN